MSALKKVQLSKEYSMDRFGKQYLVRETRALLKPHIYGEMVDTTEQLLKEI
jgi:hypothetical protein